MVTFLLNARGWFSSGLPEQALNLWPRSLCRCMNRLLVPVVAFRYNLSYYMLESQPVKRPIWRICYNVRWKKLILNNRMFLRSVEESAYDKIIAGWDRRGGRFEQVEQIIVCLTSLRASWDLVGEPNLFVFLPYMLWLFGNFRGRCPFHPAKLSQNSRGNAWRLNTFVSKK